MDVYWKKGRNVNSLQTLKLRYLTKYMKILFILFLYLLEDATGMDTWRKEGILLRICQANSKPLCIVICLCGSLCCKYCETSEKHSLTITITASMLVLSWIRHTSSVLQSQLPSCIIQAPHTCRYTNERQAYCLCISTPSEIVLSSHTQRL